MYAGIAEYFAIETWLVRVLAVSIFLLGGSGGIYHLCRFVGDLDKPQKHYDRDDIEVKKKPWQSGEPAKQSAERRESSISGKPGSWLQI